jgi:hypothetical protein
MATMLVVRVRQRMFAGMGGQKRCDAFPDVL